MRPDFLAWPFFEDRHRTLHRELAPFVKDTLGAIDTHGNERATCARLVEALGEGGWLQHVVGRFDVRTLCLIRETLAHHHGLADFAFAMQGLGSAPIALRIYEGTTEIQKLILARHIRQEYENA